MSTGTKSSKTGKTSSKPAPTGTETSSTTNVGEDLSGSSLSISRAEEKEELCHLNERLANYIEHVRALHLGNERSSRLVAAFRESQEFELAKLRQTFQTEINDLRAALDRACNEKAAAEVARRHSDATAEEARRGRLLAENELATVRRQLERAQEQLERETLRRTELENTIQSFDEEKAFQERVHREEKEQILKTTCVRLEEEFRQGVEEDYEVRLAAALREVRAETLAELDAYRSQLEADIRLQFNAMQGANSAAKEEASRLRIDVQHLRAQWEDVKCALDAMTKRCEQLQHELDSQRDYYEGEVARLREAESMLQQQLADRLREFADLMATKVALDQEILAYRTLLESEESRCHLSPSRESVFDSSYSSPTSLSRSMKRRRVDLDGEESSASEEDSGRPAGVTHSRAISRYNMQRRGLGRVTIARVDTEDAQFVIIQSTTTEDLHLGKWSLKYDADGQETVYKFNRNLILKPGATMKIWSMTATQTHSPPENLVMKGLRFFTGRKIQVTLLDSDDVEQAAISLDYEETATSHVHHSSAVLRGRPVVRAARGRRHNSAGDEKCGIM